MGKTNLKNLTAYVTAKEKEALQEHATKESRTLSNLVSKVVRDWAKKNGILPK